MLTPNATNTPSTARPAQAVDQAWLRQLDDTIGQLCDGLLSNMVGGSHWEGHLSSSALSTAVAVVALAQCDRTAHATLITHGLEWLVAHQESCGGWGDTPGSPANVSTTLLCWSALACAPAPEAFQTATRHAEEWIKSQAGSLSPEDIATWVIRFYGKDRTFSVPILTLCAIAGRLGDDASAWNHVPQLPFELAALPHQLFKWLRLPVVSYAVPALIAIGLVRHTRGRRHLLLGSLRNALTPVVLRKLTAIQPATGGFLEAIPLTGFVTMALAAAGLRDHPVAIKGVDFLIHSARVDGSWPIDIHLATWVTTLALTTLEAAHPFERLTPGQRQQAARWLVRQQHAVEHPFTHAAPGGWAWSPLPGGVPDADDTSGALLALHALQPDDAEVRDAARRGVQWLLDLQNHDGGVPTFCRGWLNLPFDRSCPDITAHALSAWHAWLPALENRDRVEKAIDRGIAYLSGAQRGDGAWVPLWFGNQQAPHKENPVYGTARVLLGLKRLGHRSDTPPMIEAGRNFLQKAQNADGGWGGAASVPSTLEETALALDALCAVGAVDRDGILRGSQWLLAALPPTPPIPAAPIGLYFASLWYSEELYPIIFSLSALQRVELSLDPDAPERPGQTDAR